MASEPPTDEYVCPNGHPFPRAIAIRCEECQASVVCVPHSDAIRLHDALERAERELTETREELARLRTADLEEAVRKMIRDD